MIDHFEASAFEHHADQVLADIVNVALDRADHVSAQAGLVVAGGQDRADQFHARLHCAGTLQHFGDEQNAVAEIDPDDPHAFDQGFSQHVIGVPAAFEQDLGAFMHFVGQAVVKVVLHLLDQVGIVQVAQDDFVVGHCASSFYGCPGI
jgi:hypothetical protein